MKTKEEAGKRGPGLQFLKNNLWAALTVAFVLLSAIFGSVPAFAHCDSYDGPVIKDATKALETNNVELVLKWIDQDQEEEIISLFEKTHDLKDGDKEVYEIVEKHFFETLVRLHRETEGAPFTGLKPAGSVEPIIRMADLSIENKEVSTLVADLYSHISQVIHEKFEKVATLSKVKDDSREQGRAFVAAYVDYTHTLEALEAILDGSANHSH